MRAISLLVFWCMYVRGGLKSFIERDAQIHNIDAYTVAEKYHTDDLCATDI